MFILDLIVIVVLSALCAVVTSPLQLVALRFLIGVAIGADYPIATSLIAEISPRKQRAMSMGMIAAALCTGVAVLVIALIRLRVTRPHGTIATAMTDMAGGQLDRDVPMAELTDEVGVIANAVVAIKEAIARRDDRSVDAARARADATELAGLGGFALRIPLP